MVCQNRCNLAISLACGARLRRSNHLATLRPAIPSFESFSICDNYGRAFNFTESESRGVSSCRISFC
jgi:hypothetical protein